MLANTAMNQSAGNGFISMGALDMASMHEQYQVYHLLNSLSRTFFLSLNRTDDATLS